MCLHVAAFAIKIQHYHVAYQIKQNAAWGRGGGGDICVYVAACISLYFDMQHDHILKKSSSEHLTPALGA